MPEVEAKLEIVGNVVPPAGSVDMLNTCSSASLTHVTKQHSPTSVSPEWVSDRQIVNLYCRLVLHRAEQGEADESGSLGKAGNFHIARHDGLPGTGDNVEAKGRK
eukprot:CAMPEP_0113828542 /NCGR_PEP_ID=MMETSP0328-20130328/5330_1 /TAXON_ID=39455 /ORGANISM="Alexandrium minutum" /LENGTH=104 /DNA_ID=CAMNT_0000796553 /DNA_START=218 /DNA_END=532 /DNA_ORIENTATION=- /assembly_acc=CAM_ASM_000350